MSEKKWCTGLHIFAFFQVNTSINKFHFLYSIFTSESGISGYFPDYPIWAVALDLSLPVAIAIFSLISAGGYFLNSYKYGFICGNIFSILYLISVGFYFIGDGYSVLGRMAVDIAYPIIVLILLNFVYKEMFSNKNSSNKKINADGVCLSTKT